MGNGLTVRRPASRRPIRARPKQLHYREVALFHIAKPRIFPAVSSFIGSTKTDAVGHRNAAALVEPAASIPTAHILLDSVTAGIFGETSLTAMMNAMSLRGPPAERKRFRGNAANGLAEAPIEVEIVAMNARFVISTGFSTTC